VFSSVSDSPPVDVSQFVTYWQKKPTFLISGLALKQPRRTGGAVSVASFTGVALYTAA